MSLGKCQEQQFTSLIFFPPLEAKLYMCLLVRHSQIRTKIKIHFDIASVPMQNS